MTVPFTTTFQASYLFLFDYIPDYKAHHYIIETQ